MSDTALAPDDLAGVMDVLKSDPGRYWSNEAGLQNRALRLCGGEGAAAPQAVAAENRSLELADLSLLAGDHSSAYWRGPNAEKHQARLQKLLLERDGVPAADDPEAWRAPVEAVARVLPLALVDEWWGSDAGLEGNVRALQDVALVLVQNLGDRQTAMDFQMSVWGLPAGAQAALYREAVRGAPRNVRPATAEDLELFCQVDSGLYTTAFVTAWGDTADRRVAAVSARVDRVLAQMTEREQADFRYWFENISPRERATLIWVAGSV